MPTHVYLSKSHCYVVILFVIKLTCYTLLNNIDYKYFFLNKNNFKTVFKKMCKLHIKLIFLIFFFRKLEKKQQNIKYFNFLVFNFFENITFAYLKK